MKIAIGSDERTHLTDFVVERLRQKGFELELYGPLSDDPIQWTEVGMKVAESVAGGRCAQGVLFCGTGTGVSIAANKVPGIRAALCTDRATAEGARKWNDANVLAMSLRLISPSVAGEIIEGWLATPPDEGERANIEMIGKIEEKYGR
ncbi:MAG: RpiB/LacA/LacB family sugar-phosphate isomerase [Deltaproteobacteria bacterium]